MRKLTNFLNEHPGAFLASSITLTALVAAAAVSAWGQMYAWQIHLDTLYVLFPVLGLLAFVIMWSQYMIEAIKNIASTAPALTRYYRYTSYLVTTLVVLHPSLLIAQRYKDGYGLPPGSYLTYVAPAQKWLVLLGTASLFLFVLFALKRWLSRFSWWPAILILNDVAIVAVYYHGLRLGSSLQHGWFKNVWLFFGITLLAALIYKYYLKFSGQQKIA